MNKVLQTDADSTIYKGNLMAGLGWEYLKYLRREKKYIVFLYKFILMPFFCLLALLPNFSWIAFKLFKGCPVHLAGKVKNPIKQGWLKRVKEINPEKIIVISQQGKALLEEFIKKHPEINKHNIEIVANIAFEKDGKLTGKSKIIINFHNKYKYIDNNLPYLGDIRDYIFYKRKVKNFILVR